MSDFSLTITAPADWQTQCEKRGLTFNSLPWADVLRQALNARIVYVRRAAGDFLLPVFVRGPLRLGYAGFPLGTSLPHGGAEALVAAAKKLPAAFRPQVIRYTPSAFDRCNEPPDIVRKAVATGIESAIPDLQAWKPEAVSSSVRRNIRKARKSGLGIRTADAIRDAGYMYDGYRNTVLRHGGRLRYTRAYFTALATLGAQQDGLNCLIAETGNVPAGYIITARHGSRTCYLHGAYTPQLQNLRPMDLLFSTALQQAREGGSQQFNFLASPVSQPSLIRYKEKWGAESRKQYTFDLAVSQPHAWLFTLMQRSLGQLRRASRPR